ncbi:nuclear transport factor 2 family protein [Mariluticola halotolerans]|uniref:nuclear transport factor 2 family protein n=1 Tax=Mariluticola halotolerans TaxID=2909283 RepID=UPI0026E25A1E|nr:nuclear transport factor 2 family protein [Mariluticola halotolerans]UJQ94712.1 nuclear transport factor 2 family protein [Mariluticola halotolerans]
MPSTSETRLAAMLDREEICDLVRKERFARDQGHWEIMAACFHPDAHIRTSWFNGNGVDYIPATQEMLKRVPGSKHWVFPGLVQVNGDKALVESPGLIFNRIELEGVEVDYQIFCRYQSRVERRDDVWRLLTFEVIFERDVMRALDPSKDLPIDWNLLAKYRPTYRFLAYLQDRRGFDLSHELLGDDRPEALRRFHEGESSWLYGAG